KQFLKLGMTTEKIENRLQKLKSRQVGGTQDWEVLLTLKVDNTNLHEFNLHKILKDYKVNSSIYQGTESKELFRCSYYKVLEELKLYIINNNIKIEEFKEWKKDYSGFDFKNLKLKKS